MNPYRQLNPSAFRPMRFVHDISEYAVTLAGEAKVYAKDFINSHPKLRAGLDLAAKKTKDYAIQCLSDYLEAKEKRESIDEYESGPMAFGNNYLSALDGTNDPSEKSARKSDSE